MAVDLEERLLGLMDRKNHWAWPHFTRPGLSRAQLLVHFRHEFHTYVRDFPVLLARVLGQGPADDVRKALASNIDEEQTGKYSFGTSHPDLFLEMMAGLGIDPSAVTAREPPLEPEAVAYRRLLDDLSATPPWIVGAAVLTIFVEGSIHEREERSGRRVVPPIETAIADHPMVRHYGCPPESMRLARAHRVVEGGHREDAWEMLLRHAPTDDRGRTAIANAVESALESWLRYRDAVVRAMSLTRS
jgi:pyrroloquinoline quinone (PQQ) biosynthesis protein C